MNRLVGRLKRAGNVVDLQAEKDRIEAWLNSRLVKSLASVRTGTARPKELDVLASRTRGC
jgi:hypothetical protein